MDERVRACREGRLGGNYGKRAVDAVAAVLANHTLMDVRGEGGRKGVL